MPAAFPISGFWSLFKSMRTRLTLAFIGFFGLLLVASGVFFRESLELVLRSQSEELLTQEWNTVRMYLRFENGAPKWIHNENDPEEAFAVERVRRILLLANRNGEVLEASNGYRAIGFSDPALLRQALHADRPWILQSKDKSGGVYFVRIGRLAAGGDLYFLALGVPVSAADQVLGKSVRIYFLLVPLLLLIVGVAGWVLAGKVLQPMNDVAEAARIVSGDNLRLRITPPGTGDELDRLVQHFNEMMDRLERGFDQVSQFTINASHELRTPVTAVRGQLEVALLNANTVDEFRDAVETAMQDVERLSQIVRSLLFLAQADSGQLALQKAPFDLASLISELVMRFQLTSEEKGVQIEFTGPETCTAFIDRGHIERMVFHLLSNAVTYTPSGGSVHVTLSHDESRVQLTVADTGPGITEGHLPHIFERFYRIRDGDRAVNKGLGLGLSLVAWVVKSHEGTIEVNSVPGRGSTFVVTLPDGLDTNELEPFPDSGGAHQGLGVVEPATGRAGIFARR